MIPRLLVADDAVQPEGSEADQNDRLALYATIEAQVQDDAPTINLYYYGSAYVKRPYVHGLALLYYPVATPMEKVWMSQWTPTGGPLAPGGQVNALAVHPAISGTVYAAVAPPGTHDSGPSVIYTTTDGADLWTSVYTAEHQVYALAAIGTNV